MLGSMWGKILGAFFGFSIAGPVGAFFGIIVGNVFDKGINFSRNADPKTLRGDARRVFQNATFSVMGHVAKLDGRVSEDEIRSAKDMMKAMDLSASEEKEAIASFAQGKLPSFNLVLVLSELKYTCRGQQALLRAFAELQYKAVTTNSRQVDIRKQQVLNALFEQLGFMPVFKVYQQYQYYQRTQNQEQYQRQKEHYYSRPNSVDELAKAYQTLGIAETCTAVELKKAYRKLMSKHHPDKLIAKGLSEKQVKEGTEKAQKIQAAYERIRTFRGL